MPARFQDLTGRRYGKLVAVEFVGFKQFSTERKRMWRCRCDCGNELVTAAMYLNGGSTNSCGCIVGKHKRIHGGTGTPEFRIWDQMRRRCRDPDEPNYGGRGIRVCDRWESSFANFLADMGPRPSPQHSIDRYPNNNGNYEPGNCRWATMREQSNNRRTSLRITAAGETRTAAEWDRMRGFASGTVWKRMHAGWSAERAVTTPLIPASLRKAGVTGGF